MTTIRELTAAAGALACLFAGGVAHAQGVSKTSILIGQSSPFSGSNKELGEDIREGLQAYFKQVNGAGGVNGRTLELIALDDANDAKRSGENARILIEQRGVLALIGYASATLSLPALPFAEKKRGEAQCRSEEHTSELQSPCNLVCRLLLEKKKKKIHIRIDD